jgi:molybdate transport system substrate-binding protein
MTGFFVAVGGQSLPMSKPIRGISSMATRQVLAELTQAYERITGAIVELESVGGVEAARRVQAGEPFDVVILGSDAIDKLLAAGHALVGSKADLVNSATAVAVREGAPRPDISSEAAVREAVRQARSVSYSTGPSGVALAKLFERWGLAEELQGRIVTPPPGVPVGSLVAQGEVELGFQQLSELLHVQGISLLGTLPKPIEINTIFSGAVCTASQQPQAVRDLLAWMRSPEAIEAKRKHGMEPA